MEENISSLYSNLVAKRNLLESARNQLKIEFVGLDNVIDQVVDLSSSWFLFPDLQERPSIINLWGLTGTGKTSLVKRFSQLIGYEKKYFHFDMKVEETLDLNDIDEINSASGNNTMIIGFDEFQHIPLVETQPVGLWDLLDSGLITRNVYPRHFFVVNTIRQKLEDALQHGVVVKDGKVVKGAKSFKKIVNEDFDPLSPDDDMWFFPTFCYNYLCGVDPMSFPHKWILRECLAGFDGIQTVTFLENKLKEFEKPSIYDCSHALIFVMGNLDIAYTMARDFNPDLNADEFHLLSKKITVSHIKNALLLTEFRSEQISRLGNNHIIYPAFSSISYRLIIQKEVERIGDKFKEKFGIRLLFDPTVLDLIYREGVYPTQGTRPVFSTINRIITSKLGIILTQLLLNKLECSQVRLSSDADRIIIHYLNGETILHSMEIIQQLNLESLRRNRRDDMQAISAVHESGHAVLSMILLRTVPDAIYSVTVEAGMGGFIHTRLNWEYISRSQIVLQLAMMLGGYAAEEFVFGRNQRTAGSESDLQRASAFASRMVRCCGMGETHYSYQVEILTPNYAVIDQGLHVNKEVKVMLDEALKLAEHTIWEQEILLLHMSGYLADNRSMSVDIAREMLAKYVSGNQFAGIVDNCDLLYYRDALMNRIKMVNEQVFVPENLIQSSSITLNSSNNVGL